VKDTFQVSQTKGNYSKTGKVTKSSGKTVKDPKTKEKHPRGVTWENC